MAHAFDLTLLVGSIAVIGVSLFNAAKILKKYGLPVLFDASCLVASSLFLFLGQWMPFRHHALLGNGPNGN